MAEANATASIPERLRRLSRNLEHLLTRLPRIAAYVRGWDEKHPGAWAGELLELFDVYTQWANEQNALGEILTTGYLGLCRSDNVKAASILGLEAENYHEAAGQWAGAHLEHLDFLINSRSLLWVIHTEADRISTESRIPAARVGLTRWAEGMSEASPSEMAILKLELNESLRLCSLEAEHRTEVVATTTTGGICWDRTNGRLTIDGKLAKTIKNLGPAKNVTLILDAFQELGWPDRIDDPLPNGADSQRLKDTLDSLNDNLVCLRFSRDGTGKGIRCVRSDAQI